MPKYSRLDWDPGYKQAIQATLCHFGCSSLKIFQTCVWIRCRIAKCIYLDAACWADLLTLYYFNVLLVVHIVLESLKFNYWIRTKGTPKMQLFRILHFGSFVCFSWWNPSLLTWRYEIYWCFISKNYILPFSFLILFTKFKSAFLIYLIVSEKKFGVPSIWSLFQLKILKL